MKVVGYIGSDSLSFGKISHRQQNLTIQQFLNRSDKKYLLSWTEGVHKSPFILNSLLAENFYEGICFFSLEQLFLLKDPLVFVQNFKQRGLWIGFAREEIFFFQSHNFAKIEQLIWLKMQIASSVASSEFSLAWLRDSELTPNKIADNMGH